MTGRQVGGDPIPDFEAQDPRRRDAVDAKQADGAKDEGNHRGLELRPTGQPHACNVAAVIDGTREPGQRLRAYVVDGATELRALQWARPVVYGLPQQHLRRTNGAEVAFSLRLA